MEWYVAWGYPAVLIATGVLALAGAVTMLVVRAHPLLRALHKGFVAVVLAQAALVIVAVVQGAPAFMTLSYMAASLVVLFPLGISRLGTPEAAADEPGRPVLQPDQRARVDAGAAILVAIAQAVIAWRFVEIFQGALT